MDQLHRLGLVFLDLGGCQGLELHFGYGKRSRPHPQGDAVNEQDGRGPAPGLELIHCFSYRGRQFPVIVLAGHIFRGGDLDSHQVINRHLAFPGVIGGHLPALGQVAVEDDDQVTGR